MGSIHRIERQGEIKALSAWRARQDDYSEKDMHQCIGAGKPDHGKQERQDSRTAAASRGAAWQNGVWQTRALKRFPEPSLRRTQTGQDNARPVPFW